MPTHSLAPGLVRPDRARTSRRRNHQPELSRSRRRRAVCGPSRRGIAHPGHRSPQRAAMPSRRRVAGRRTALGLWRERRARQSLHTKSHARSGRCARTWLRASACRSLRQLHDGWDGLIGDLLFFSPFQTSRNYVATSRRIGADLPSDIDRMLEATRKLSHTIAPYIPTLCHNDMLPANVLDDGQRMWIVDWEYAGMGHPLFDLAGFSANCDFPKSKTSSFSRAIAASFDRGIYTSFASSKSRACFAMPSGASCKPLPRISMSIIPSTRACLF